MGCRTFTRRSEEVCPSCRRPPPAGPSRPPRNEAAPARPDPGRAGSAGPRQARPGPGRADPGRRPGRGRRGQGRRVGHGTPARARVRSRLRRDRAAGLRHRPVRRGAHRSRRSARRPHPPYADARHQRGAVVGGDAHGRGEYVLPVAAGLPRGPRGRLGHRRPDRRLLGGGLLPRRGPGPHVRARPRRRTRRHGHRLRPVRSDRFRPHLAFRLLVAGRTRHRPGLVHPPPRGARAGRAVPAGGRPPAGRRSDRAGGTAHTSNRTKTSSSTPTRASGPSGGRSATSCGYAPTWC